MKNKWKTIRLGVLLVAVPLLLTAVASAQQRMGESNPFTNGLKSEIAKQSPIGLARVHTVALNREMSVEGRIASIDARTKTTNGLSRLRVFFVQNGKVVSESTTQADGSFVARGLTEGVYSFIAAGENGFAAYGVRVVDQGMDNFDNVMEATAVSPRFSVIKKILNERVPVEVTKQILNYRHVDSDFKLVGSNRVRLKHGTLFGQVAAIFGGDNSVEGTSVHILQNDRQIAEVQVDESGSFMVADLEPGIYDFVAAGPNGFAAVRFEAVNDSEKVAGLKSVDSEKVPASFASRVIAAQDPIPGEIAVDAGPSDSLDVCLTCQQDNAFVGEQLSNVGEPVQDYAPIEYAGESIACGCAAGGCCGAAGGGGVVGGGYVGGGGYGNFGRLLGAAGVTIGVIALASESNGRGRRRYKRDDPKPSSPYEPYYDEYDPYDDEYEPYDDKYDPYESY